MLGYNTKHYLGQLFLHSKSTFESTAPPLNISMNTLSIFEISKIIKNMQSFFSISTMFFWISLSMLMSLLQKQLYEGTGLGLGLQFY